MEKELKQAAQSHGYKVDLERFREGVWHKIEAENGSLERPRRSYARPLRIAAAALVLTVPLGYFTSASTLWKNIDLQFIKDIDRTHQRTPFDYDYYSFLMEKSGDTKLAPEQAKKVASYPILELDAPQGWTKEHSFSIRIGDAGEHDVHFFEFFKDEAGRKVIASQHQDDAMTKVVNDPMEKLIFNMPEGAKTDEFGDDLAMLQKVGKAYTLDVWHPQGQQVIDYSFWGTDRESVLYFAHQYLK